MDPLARVPMVLVAYQIPPGNTPENYALRVLADILGTGRSSRLYEELVKNKQLATDVQVQPDARRGPSLIYFFVTLRPGVKPEDAEKALYEAIGSVAKNGVTAEEIKKARAAALAALEDSYAESAGEYKVGEAKEAEAIKTGLKEKELAFQQGLISHIEGDRQRAKDDLLEFTRLHKDARGWLAGREVVFADELAKLATESEKWPAPKRESGWPTFAGWRSCARRSFAA